MGIRESQRCSSQSQFCQLVSATRSDSAARFGKHMSNDIVLMRLAHLSSLYRKTAIVTCARGGHRWRRASACLCQYALWIWPFSQHGECLHWKTSWWHTLLRIRQHVSGKRINRLVWFAIIFLLRISGAICWPMLLSTFSHYSGFHIFANMYVLHSFANAATLSLGTEQFLGVYLAAGVVSSLASYVMKATVGAAGMSLGAVRIFLTNDHEILVLLRCFFFCVV